MKIRHKVIAGAQGAPIILTSGISHVRDSDSGKLMSYVTISGIEYTNCMRLIIWALIRIRTMIFPNTVRIVFQAAFNNIRILRSVILNEGLEVLGYGECKPDGTLYAGVFEGCGLTRVWLPCTLRKIGYNVFKGCERLKGIWLPKGLEYIGQEAFRASGLKSIVFPKSLKEMGARAFSYCEQLRSV